MAIWQDVAAKDPEMAPPWLQDHSTMAPKWLQHGHDSDRASKWLHHGAKMTPPWPPDGSTMALIVTGVVVIVGVVVVVGGGGVVVVVVAIGVVVVLLVVVAVVVATSCAPNLFHACKGSIALSGYQWYQTGVALATPLLISWQPLKSATAIGK